MTKTKKKNERNIELCRLVKENDLLAETTLLMENEGLIVQVAKRMEDKREVNSSDGIDLEDLLQEGRFAMLTAAKHFDEGRNVKFSTYAYDVMKNAMIDLCDKCQSTFERHMEKKGLTRVFLDDDTETGEGLVEMSRTTASQTDPTGNLAVLHVMLEKMRNRLKMLPERQRMLLAYHYGLGAIRAKTIAETAAYYHLSENYLRKIEETALERMREMMNDGKIV